jgi:adenylate cyclase
MRYIESQLRLGSGIILALYVVQHLINHAFGIVSIEAAEAYRETIGAVFQSLPGLVLLYGSLLIHATIALRSIYRRSSLRLSLWQWLQLLLGLSILPLVVGHAVANRGFDLLGNIDPNYYYVVTSILLKPVFLVKLIFLIAIIWIHMAIGLHYWLRIRKTYPRILPYAYTLVVLIPALAYVGLFSMLQQASGWLEDEQRLDRIYAANIAMDSSDVEFLRGLETQAWIVMAALLLLTLVARQIRAVDAGGAPDQALAPGPQGYLQYYPHRWSQNQGFKRGFAARGVTQCPYPARVGLRWTRALHHLPGLR